MDYDACGHTITVPLNRSTRSTAIALSPLPGFVLARSFCLRRSERVSGLAHHNLNRCSVSYLGRRGM